MDKRKDIHIKCIPWAMTVWTDTEQDSRECFLHGESGRELNMKWIDNNSMVFFTMVTGTGLTSFIKCSSRGSPHNPTHDWRGMQLCTEVTLRHGGLTIFSEHKMRNRKHTILVGMWCNILATGNNFYNFGKYCKNGNGINMLY